MLEFIHILLVKVELGPFSERQVRQYLEVGHLLPSDLARYEPHKEWTPLSEVLSNLPQPIVVAPPITNPPQAPETIEPAVVLVAPAPPILEAPLISSNAPLPETIEPAIVLVSPASPDSEPPPAILEAPVVAEFVPGALQPAVTLHSPLLPARQLLPPAKAESPLTPSAADSSPKETVTTPSSEPAPQLLPTEKESIAPEPSLDEAPVPATDTKEREITPPPKPVVPYNQPVPRPGPSVVDHWHAWAKYAATALAFLLIICWWEWETVGAALARSWAYLNLLLIQAVDSIVASFSSKPST